MMNSLQKLAQILEYELTPQTNFHGANELFDYFNKNYIGTGEGAAAHGRGWYSADRPNTAARYVLQNNKPITFLDNPNVTMKELNELYKQGVDLKPKSDYLYKVYVPNENFMLNLQKPYAEQSAYVRDRLLPYLKKQLPKDYLSFKNMINRNFISNSKLQELFKTPYMEQAYQEYLRKPETLLPYMEGIEGDKIVSDLGEKELSNLGIKGLRTVGRKDGPINITFSDEDIKIAGKQKPKGFVSFSQNKINKIPSLGYGFVEDFSEALPTGKDVLKAGAKLGLDVASKAVTPLMIMEGLTQPVADDTTYYNPQLNRLYGGVYYNQGR